VRADVPLVGWEGGLSGLVGAGREPEERLMGEVAGF